MEISGGFEDKVNLLVSSETQSDLVNTHQKERLKSQIPTYEEWMNRKFYDSRYSKEFTEIIGSGLVKVARQFGMKTKSIYFLSKAEYIELGKWIYGVEEVLKESIYFKIKSKIPTCIEWMKAEFYKKKHAKKFTEKFGCSLGQAARELGVNTKSRYFVSEAEYVELGSLLYGEAEVIAFRKPSIEKVYKEVELSEDQIETAIEEIIQTVTEATNVDVNEETPKEEIISKIREEVPTYLDWIRERFYEKGRGKEFTEITGSSFSKVARQFGVRKGVYGGIEKQYADLGNLIYEPDTVTFMRGLVILSNSN